MSEAPASNEATEGVVGPAPLNPNEAKAFEWYLKGATSGSLRAMKAVINCYDNGEGTCKDETKGFEWCKTVAENEKCGPEDLFILGRRFETGKGVAVSLRDAAIWYRHAANLKHVEAMFRLAEILIQNPAYKNSYDITVEWYTKAGDLGHVDAMYKAGMCYAYGNGSTSVNRYSAKQWFKKAAEKGHLEAMYEAGVIRAASDQKEAVASYVKVASLGHVKGMYQLGRCFEKGLGVAKDDAKAVEWYTKAANLKNTDAMRALAACYKNGIGVAKSVDKFIEWATAASDLGDAEAMYQLGEYYMYEELAQARETYEVV